MSRDVVQPLVYRLQEACKKLDISEDTAYRRIAERKAPFHRAYKDGQWRIPVEDVVRHARGERVSCETSEDGRYAWPHELPGERISDR